MGAGCYLAVMLERMELAGISLEVAELSYAVCARCLDDEDLRAQFMPLNSTSKAVTNLHHLPKPRYAAIPTIDAFFPEKRCRKIS